jgi:hypothetical protein
MNETTIEKIDSQPGLRTALELIGEANRKAHEDGRCVIDFYVGDDGRMVISDVTSHVEELEDGQN